MDVIDDLVCRIGADTTFVVVDGAAADPSAFADLLAAAVRATGQPCARLTDATPLADEDAWRADHTPTTVVLADGPRWRAHPPAGAWDLVVWLTSPTGAVVVSPPE